MTEAPRAFAIDAAEGVIVHVDDSSDDETFDVVVLTEGQEVEKHTNVTAASLSELESDHFSVQYIEPPTAEAEGQ